MIIPAGYPELFQRERTRALTPADRDADLNWTPLPTPPAPPGINYFPANPSVSLVARKYLGRRQVTHHVSATFHVDGDSIQVSLAYTYAANVTAVVSGVYNLLVAGTATQNAPFSRSVSYTYGASQTDSFSVGMSVTAEAGIEGLGSLSTTLSTTFDHSVTLEQSTTTSNTFSIQGTDRIPEVTACWWQPWFQYELFFDDTEVNGSPGTRKGDSDHFTVSGHSGPYQFTLAVVEPWHYTMPVGDNIYVVSQYPPPQ